MERQNEFVTVQSITHLNEIQIRKALLTCSILMIIAALLPFYKVDALIMTLDVNMLKIDYGRTFIIVPILIMLFMYMDRRTPITLCSIVTFIVYCLINLGFNQYVKELIEEDDYFDIASADMITKGSGFYLLTFSVIVLLSLGIYYYLQDERNRVFLKTVIKGITR